MEWLQELGKFQGLILGLQALFIFVQIIVSALLAWFVLQLNQNLISTLESDKIFFEIEKILLSDPQLYEFYNTPYGRLWNSLKNEDKKLYIFNEINFFVFALVYRELRHKRISRSYWKLWERWLVDLIRKSSAFRDVCRYSSRHFEPEFMKFVNKQFKKFGYYELSFSVKGLRVLRKLHAHLFPTAFPDPNEYDDFKHMKRYLWKKRVSWHRKDNYHILVLLDRGKPVAAVVADYFGEVNAGVIEFIVVADNRRGEGLDKEMLSWVLAILEEDARKAGYPYIDYIFAETHDPYRIQKTQDSVNPIARLRYFGSLGCRIVDFNYIQPPLSKDKKHVKNLLLIVAVLNDKLPDTHIDKVKLLAFLRNYVKWVTGTKNPEEHPDYQEMKRDLDEKYKESRVKLLPVSAFLKRRKGRNRRATKTLS